MTRSLSHTIFLLLFCLVSLGAGLGCGHTLPEFAAQADAVDVKVLVPSGPTVDLGERSRTSPTNNLAAAIGDVMEVASMVESDKVRNRLRKLIQAQRVGDVVHAAAIDELSSNIPFGYASSQESDGFIQLQLVNYGVIQSGGGPAFIADYKVDIYRASDNEHVYWKTIACQDNEFYTPIDTVGNLAGTIRTIEYVNKMSDEQLVQAVEAAVDRCTSQVFLEIRSDAN